MHEFEAVSVSSYEAGSLAAKLTEKSNEGWDVVAIVPAGSDITAYLKRATGGSDAASTTADADADAVGAVAGSSRAPVEPAGWGSAPASTGSDSGAGSTGSWGSSTTDDTATTSGWGATGTSGTSGGWGSTASNPASPAAPAQPATPTVAADWYADPAGRYELRYWNGTAWTEHVSRNGQQFTDPPVA